MLRKRNRGITSEEFTRSYTFSFHISKKKSADTRTRPRVLGCILFLFQLACMVRNRWKHVQDELLTPSELRDTPFSFPTPSILVPKSQSGSPDSDFCESKIFEKKSKIDFHIFFRIALIPSKLVRNSSKRAETVLSHPNSPQGGGGEVREGWQKLQKSIFFFENF